MGRVEPAQLRRIAVGLPEVTERVSHGAPGFYVAGRRALCRLHDHHRGDSRISLWCPAPAGVAEALVSTEPDRFFHPPASTSGVFSDWLGMYLDGPGEEQVDWAEVARVIEDAYRVVAPRRLVRVLDARR